MITNKILNDIVRSSKRCEITLDMLSLSEMIDLDENLRIELWLNEETKQIPEKERHSVEKDKVYKKGIRFHYGIYKIIRTCC